MNRRTFVTGSIISGALLGAGMLAWLNTGVDKNKLTIEGSLEQLKKLSGKTIQSTGAWSAAQTFVHCAQSVEYSIHGFPEHKSDVFKNTIGKTAFAAFSKRGKMSHALDDPIPGAPALLLDQEMASSLHRLVTALTEFQQYGGFLRPHFAYGQLSKQDYALAHVMHLNNHFQELSVDVL